MTRKKSDRMHLFSKVKYPPMENVDKSHKQIVRRIKPQQTGIDAGACDSVCYGDAVSTNHPRGDDLNR